jgi:hypothetical protein
MNDLKQALKLLSSLHANAGNIHISEQKDILILLYSAQFTIESLIKLFGGAK